MAYLVQENDILVAPLLSCVLTDYCKCMPSFCFLAVDIADSVQQELLTKRHQVDFLQIRMHGLEESLGAAIKV